MENPITTYSAQRITDGHWKPEEVSLMCECTLSIYVNGILHCRQFVSPMDLQEFVVGRLIADGMISTPAGIRSLQISTETMEAQVSVAAISDSEKNSFCEAEAPVWEVSWLNRLSYALQHETPLYALCESTHSCFLMKDGSILRCMEDIGRHNAFDKIIGWANLAQIPLETCIVFTSGRVPKDMVLKAIRVGIKVLVSKALPTAEAVQQAQEHGVVLLHISKRLGILRFS